MIVFSKLIQSFEKQLWGIGKSGYRCKDCQISCHKDCRNHVVMECRPNRTLSLRGKSHKKRLKYADQEWKGSTDSSISDMEHLTPKSSISLNGDVFSQSFDSVTSQEVKMREKIIRLEMEKESLKKENYNLKSKLRSAETTVTVLQSQLGLVRQQSVKFMLEQLERLNTCKETDV